MELSTLKPAQGSRSKRRRVGRGEGSGRGKTSGHGGKGQTARSGGKPHIHFEGGQTPLYRRVPKIGFRSRKRTHGENIYTIVNLADLEKFDAGAVVDVEALVKAGCKIGRNAGIKLLGRGEISKQLSVKVHAVSASAKAKIEARGGTVELITA